MLIKGVRSATRSQVCRSRETAISIWLMRVKLVAGGGMAPKGLKTVGKPMYSP